MEEEPCQLPMVFKASIDLVDIQPPNLRVVTRSLLISLRRGGMSMQKRVAHRVGSGLQVQKLGRTL